MNGSSNCSSHILLQKVVTTDELKEMMCDVLLVGVVPECKT